MKGGREKREIHVRMERKRGRQKGSWGRREKYVGMDRAWAPFSFRSLEHLDMHWNLEYAPRVPGVGERKGRAFDFLAVADNLHKDTNKHAHTQGKREGESVVDGRGVGKGEEKDHARMHAKTAGKMKRHTNTYFQLVTLHISRSIRKHTCELAHTQTDA